MRVHFLYSTGLAGVTFSRPELWGSWDADGRPSDPGSTVPMESGIGADGSAFFRADVDFPDAQRGSTYRWGVRVDGPAGRVWAIVTEVPDPASRECVRTFQLESDAQLESYSLSHARRLGANKRFPPGGGPPGARFAVWAPHARAVELVFGEDRHGYIADDGTGTVGAPIPMRREPDGVWWVDDTMAPALASFHALDHRPYMFRLRKEDAGPNEWSYRTDLFSRCQIGHGVENPRGRPYDGPWRELAGTVSCSVVIDVDTVTRSFSEPDWPETEWVDAQAFWADEFDPARPVPQRVEDLVIYEMHIGGLGYSRVENGEPAPGTLEDAIGMLDYLVELGINAIELMPMAEYEGWAAWGYATSHYAAVEFSGGGRDQMKYFVRECHRRGIAVILDVVYNHYSHDAERAEWHYDSDRHEHNIYYWYEGKPSDYPQYEWAAHHAEPPSARPAAGHGGYVDNMSTGYAPRYHEEYVRKMFISSALMLVTEFHVDGFRVDQTTSIHAYNVLHADGRAVDRANAFGAKFLREWTRAVRLVAPRTFLFAEDHSGWDAVTRATTEGGLGFDAVWYADFYHHLAGDTDKGSDYAKLLTTAARADGEPLAMGYFAGALQHTSRRTVVYHESHDEAGNSRFSGRTLAIAVDRAPLVGETRRYAEARARVAAGLTLLSAGIPMFFMGEEVGFRRDYRYEGFLPAREDFFGLKAGSGRDLFRFYRDVIALRRSPEHPELRTDQPLRVIHANDRGRVLAFLRGFAHRQSLVVASLCDSPYPSYDLDHPDLAGHRWREIFNGDAREYGGWGEGNAGATLTPAGSRLTLAIPANAVLVLRADDPW